MRKLTLLALAMAPAAVFADDGSGDRGMIALAAAIVGAIAVLGGTFGQGKAVCAALEAIGRNPAAADKVQTPMILGLALIESLVILGWLIAFFLQGKV